MSNTVKCPFCDTNIENNIEICPNCKSWFVEPHLPKIKFTEFRSYIALSIISLGFINLFWFFVNRKNINNLIVKPKDQIKFDRLLTALIIAVVTFFICMLGLEVGKKAGSHLADKAGYLGGGILIFIGLEIFIKSWL